MAAETLAFEDAFDAAFTLRHDLSVLMGRHIPIFMFTDSARLFDSITSIKRTTECRLMLDIYAAREAYKKREIDNIALIRSQYNIADAMTKVKGNGALLNALETHKLAHPVVKYVFSPVVSERSTACN
jgi:hypothetical protein